MRGLPESRERRNNNVNNSTEALSDYSSSRHRNYYGSLHEYRRKSAPINAAEAAKLLEEYRQNLLNHRRDERAESKHSTRSRASVVQKDVNDSPTPLDERDSSIKKRLARLAMERSAPDLRHLQILKAAYAKANETIAALQIELQRSHTRLARARAASFPSSEAEFETLRNQHGGKQNKLSEEDTAESLSHYLELDQNEEVERFKRLYEKEASMKLEYEGEIKELTSKIDVLESERKSSERKNGKGRDQSELLEEIEHHQAVSEHFRTELAETQENLNRMQDLYGQLLVYLQEKSKLNFQVEDLRQKLDAERSNLKEEMRSSPKPSDKLQKRNKNLESMVSKLQATIAYLNNIVKRLRDEELSPSSYWSSVAESESDTSTGNPWSPSSSNVPSPRRGRRSQRPNPSGDIDSIDKAGYKEPKEDEREYRMPEDFHELKTRYITLREDFASLQVHYRKKTDLLKKVKHKYAFLKREQRVLSAKMTVYEEAREDYENLQSNHEVLRREHTELTRKYNTLRNPITSIDETSITPTISPNLSEDTKELQIKLTQYQRSHKDLSNHNSLLTEELSNMRFIIRSFEQKPRQTEQEAPLPSPSSLLTQNRHLHTALVASQSSCAILRRALDYLEDQYTDFQLQYNALYETSAPSTQAFARAMWKPWNRVGETTLPQILPKNPLVQDDVPSASSVLPPESSVLPGCGDVLRAVVIQPLSLFEWVGRGFVRVLGVRVKSMRRERERERGEKRSNERRGVRQRERERELVRTLNAERRLFYTGARRYLMLWGEKKVLVDEYNELVGRFNALCCSG